ncbi:MAG: hypothetical protein U5K38_14460 [Woeseiaceae bacterium]|nr:hypothetical protein [Woeseiaceae bacterium]
MNETFKKNPLTKNVVAGLVSVSVAKNGAGQIQLVTMKRENRKTRASTKCGHKMRDDVERYLTTKLSGGPKWRAFCDWGKFSHSR